MEKRRLSQTKIFLWFIGITVLIYRKQITGAIESIYSWFAESLDGMRSFPRGAQAAISFLSIVALVTLAFRLLTCLIIRKKDKDVTE